MGAKVQGHPTRNQPHEGSGKRPNSRLHGRPSTTNRIPIHRRGAALLPSDKVQNVVVHFIGARTYRKPSYHLLTIKQSSQESLRSYVQRFNMESLKVDILDEKFVITAFIARLVVQLKDLMFSISKNPQASMAEVLAKTEKYTNGEEALLSKQRSSSTKK